ncbi:MAG: hypothetical protein EA422_09750 [Gemmatimonadales bacterium]|nr:MAG: hypothetical protein EA422_09750 [Gemmatimonadales bacterium]
MVGERVLTDRSGGARPGGANRDGRLTRRWNWLAILGGALVAATGCSDDPTGVSQDELHFQADLEAVSGQLTSLAELEIQGLEAVRRTPPGEAVGRLLLDAGAAAWEADEARAIGHEAAAEGLERAQEAALTRGLLMALGATEAAGVVDRLEAALAHLESRWRGMDRADNAAQEGLREGRRGAERARQALGAGDPATALAEAAQAGDVIRGVDAEVAARRAVSAAEALLERADALAGTDPTPPIARALDRARETCRGAREALEAEEWRRAVAGSAQCAGLSRSVIARLLVGIGPDALAQRAEAMVVRAGDLLERARSAAGGELRPPAARWLQEADELFLAARAHLADGDYRRAIQAAQGSSARSIRVLAVLGSGSG